MNVEYQGKTFELPDGTSPEEAVKLVSQIDLAPKNLFSTAGVASAFRTVVPSILQGIEGSKLRDYEAMVQAYEKDPVSAEKFGITKQNYEESKTGADMTRRRLMEIQKDLDAESQGQSRPLSWFTSAVNSTAQNLPGMAAALATRNLGPMAAAPALTTAENVTSGQTYAADRTPDAEGKTKGTLEQSRINADVQGTVEAAFELYPVSFFIDQVGKQGLGKFLAGYFGRELATELPTTAAQDISDWATVNKDMPMKDFMAKLGNDLVDTAASTVMGAGMMGPAGHLMAKAGGQQPETPAPEGGDNSKEVPPSQPATTVQVNFDHPTTPPDSTAMATLNQMLAQVDPSTVTPEFVAQAKAEKAAELEAEKAPALPEAAAAWAPALKIGDPDVGATQRQATNAYVNPNDAVPMQERPIVLSTVDGAEGKSMNQVMPQTGTYTVGEFTEDRPEGVMRAVHDTIEEWRQKYLPNATIVISNESLALPTALGAHWSNAPGMHVIVPAVFRSPKDVKTFNRNAQVGIFYTLAHEFGHAIIDDRFYGNLDKMLAERIKQESRLGTVSPEAVAALEAVDPLKAAVAREFNNMKSRIMDGSMPAQELVDHWIGPAKAGRKFLEELDVAPQAPAQDVLDALQRSAVDVARKRGLKGFKKIKEAYAQKYFSLDEFMAEQTARHAYKQKWDKTSQLGQYFSAALQSLRNFFANAKKEGLIKPGVAFQEWIESLTTADTTKTITQEAIESKAKEGEAVVATKVAKAKIKQAAKLKKPHKKLEKIQHNVETDTDEGKTLAGRQMVTNLVKSGAIEANDPAFKELLGYIRDKDWESFIDKFQSVVGKSVQWELDPETESKLRIAAARKRRLAERNEQEADLEGEELIDDSSVDAKLIQGYTEYLAALRGQGPFNSPKAAVQNMQENIKRAGGTPGTEQEVLAAAKDAYDARQKIVNRLRDTNYELDNALDFTLPQTFAAGASLTEADAKNPTILAEAAREWADKGYASRFFKAWFGDWQNNKERASKAVTPSGKPLGLFHATRQDFEAFTRGDIGFHFGTLRAAHNRHYDTDFLANSAGTLQGSYRKYEDLGKAQVSERAEIMEPMVRREMKLVQDVRFIPAVVNIRNPLIFGEEYTKMWHNPFEMITALRKEGFISDEKAAELEGLVTVLTENADGRQLGDLYYLMAPIRAALKNMGYDGIKYINTVEGDTSWVAFEPNQVKSLLGTKTFSKSTDMNYEVDFDLSVPEGETGNFLHQKLKTWMANSGPLRRSMRWLQGTGPKVLEIQQLAHLNPQLSPLMMFSRFNTYYNSLKSQLMASADRVIGAWGSPKLSAQQYKQVGDILLAERDGGELWFDLTRNQSEVDPLKFWTYTMSKRAMDELKQRGVDVTTPEGELVGQLVLEAKNALLQQVNGWEQAFANIAMHRYAGRGQDKLERELKLISAVVHPLRTFPYFPQGRFGNYIITIEHDKPEGAGREVLHREAFESMKEWENAWIAAEKNKKPGERVVKIEISDMNVALLALPFEFVDMAASELNLSDEPGPNGEPSQVERLMAILQPVKATRILKQYDLQRLKMTGGDKDPYRSFAAFTWHNSNLIAKTQYRAAFNSTIREVHSLLRLAQRSPDPASLDLSYKLQRIEKAMKDARDYIMHPANELQGLRTAVSLMYLGLNVKTALLNLFGMVTTASDITSRLGVVEGTKLFLKSNFQAFSTIKLTDLNASKDRGFIDPETQAALDRAIEKGILSQSYAYHLAGVANSGTLWRMPAVNSLQRVTHGAIDLAMYLFRLTELSTRRATFLAQYQAEALKPTAEFNKFDAAVHRTNLLQNDYSLGNRVPLMRGGGATGPLVPLATIFMSFVQHMAFHSYGGYELGERRAAVVKGQNPRTMLGGYTMRIWLVLLLLAGYEGLPGMENFLDLIQAMWRKFGGDKPIRQYLRETVQSLEVEWLTPGLAAHGLGYNLAGFDISRSVGLGRIVPGTDALATPKDKPDEQIGNLVLDLMGPFGGFIKFAANTIIDDKPLSEKLTKMPGGLGNIYTAYRWSQDGVRSPTSALITLDQETGQIRDLTTAEIIGKALGFNPSIVAENREMRFAQYDRKIYWQNRRDMLMDDIWRARVQKDKEAEASARVAVKDFNASIPDEPQYKGIKITGIDIYKSMQARQRNMKRDEQNLPSEKRYRGIYRNVQESFE